MFYADIVRENLPIINIKSRFSRKKESYVW